MHRDIKPSNFLIGLDEKRDVVYVIDFAFANKYWRKKENAHVPFTEGNDLVGTLRYISVNTHMGYEQSRRDDLEALGYMFIQFLKSKLPWQGIVNRNRQAKEQLIKQSKIETDPISLCQSLPNEFVEYFQYVKSLEFEQQPDYDYLRTLFTKFREPVLILDWLQPKPIPPQPEPANNKPTKRRKRKCLIF